VGMPQSEAPEAIQKGVVRGNVSSMEILKDFNFACLPAVPTEANLFVVVVRRSHEQGQMGMRCGRREEVFDDLRREQSEWTGKVC